MKAKFIVLHVALPILVGGLIYICWRDPGLLMFQWFRALGLEPLIVQLRTATSPLQPALPSWFIYSLPDGIWVYALTAFMTHVWSEARTSLLKLACLWTGPVLGAGSELGQLARIVPGSFDGTDFLFYLGAGLLAFFAVSRSKPRRSINEQPNKEDFAFVKRAGSFSVSGLRQRVLDE